MDLRKIARDSAQTLANYLTYQSVRVVLEQLMETNPPAAQRLREFFATASFQGDSELYLQRLMGEDQEMAFRIMTVRDHLATNIPEFLPEMVRSRVQNSNLDQRKSLFERLTQIGPDSTVVELSASHPECELPLELPLDLRSLPNDPASDAAA